jgi:hypothetical protein
MREWKNTCDILYMSKLMHRSNDLEIFEHPLTEFRVNFHPDLVNWPCNHQLNL